MCLKNKLKLKFFKRKARSGNDKKLWRYRIAYGIKKIWGEYNKNESIIIK